MEHVPNPGLLCLRRSHRTLRTLYRPASTGCPSARAARDGRLRMGQRCRPNDNNFRIQHISPCPYSSHLMPVWGYHLRHRPISATSDCGGLTKAVLWQLTKGGENNSVYPTVSATTRRGALTPSLEYLAVLILKSFVGRTLANWSSVFEEVYLCSPPISTLLPP